MFEINVKKVWFLFVTYVSTNQRELITHLPSSCGPWEKSALDTGRNAFRKLRQTPSITTFSGYSPHSGQVNAATGSISRRLTNAYHACCRLEIYYTHFEPSDNRATQMQRGLYMEKCVIKVIYQINLLRKMLWDI